jgi:hypothetical protein
MTTVDTDCQIQGGFVVCPTEASVSFAGQPTYINAELSCPLDAVQQSDFIEASQLGICDCTTALLGNSPNDPTTPLDCQCFVCPLGSRLGFAFQCEVPMVGPCFNFSCSGDCNGDLGISVDQDTSSPTQAPTKTPSGGRATAGGGSSGIILPAMMIGYLLVKMMR